MSKPIEVNDMRQAQLNMPLKGNSGEDLTAIHSALREDLCRYFGGFTAFEGRGGWLSPSGKLYDEPIMIYQVSCNVTKTISDIIQSLAEFHGRKAKQEAVYYIIDGESAIVDLTVKEVA